MLGKIEGRRTGRQRMSWLDGITASMDMEFEQTPGVGDGQGGLACCGSWGHESRTRLSDWTTIMSEGLWLCHLVSFGELVIYIMYEHCSVT